jgi:pyruvate dehydrogenase E1 component
VFYYITLMNENYPHPPLPEGAQEGILRGGYLIQRGKAGKMRARLLGSGSILRECIAAAELLASDFDVAADVYSITSFSELRREALECERWNLLHPGEAVREPYVKRLLDNDAGPLVAATDYVRAVPDQIRQWVSAPYATLGTDGFGRSDARMPLRQHFEVDRRFIALAALNGLADEGRLERSAVAAAIKQLEIDPEKPNPVYT